MEEVSHENDSVKGDEPKKFPLLSTKAPIGRRNPKGDKLKLPKLSKSMPAAPSNGRNYKYKLYPGNNSRVVMMSIHKRPWWHTMQPLPDEEESKLDVAPQLIWEMYRNPIRYRTEMFVSTVLNHIQNNNCLVSKKGLYYCIKAYCESNQIDPCTIIPKTFYLTSNSDGSRDDSIAFAAFNEEIRLQTKSNMSIKNGDEFPDSQTVTASETNTTTEPNVDTSESLESTIWILKPASRTNRGYGIKVVKGISEVMTTIAAKESKRSRNNSRCGSSSGNSSSKSKSGKKEVKCKEKEEHKEKEKENKPENGELSREFLTKSADKIAAQKGWIVQLYMDRPLLVSGRKFDIRCYVLITLFGKDKLKAYFYKDMYVRTSCKRYNLNELSDRETHLTNDAVQKHSKNYGKFEDGNKLTMEELQESINRDYPGSPRDIVQGSIIPEIKRLSQLSINAAANDLSESSISKSFELLGYDYMIDDSYKPYLIEINSNPCLEFACPLLTNLITSLIDNVMTKVLDPLFPPPLSNRTKMCQDAIEMLRNEPDNFEQIFP